MLIRDRGYVAGGMLRGLLVGLIVTIIALFFTRLHVEHLFVVIAAVLLTSIVFALGGFVNAVFARNFDQITFVPTFILTPMINSAIVYFAMATGMVPLFTGVMAPWTTPPIISGLIIGGWRHALLQAVCLAVAIAIYFLFARAADRKAYADELAAHEEHLHEAEELDTLLQRLGKTSTRLQKYYSNFQADPRRFALNVSNVRGPHTDVTVLDLPVESVHSIAEIGERHALRIAVVSLGDQLCFGFCADPELVTDLEVMAEGVEIEAERLAAAVRP